MFRGGIEQVAKLFKGSSSHWVNEQRLVLGRFAWQRGCGAFSVSQSQVQRVTAYIAGQEEHHKTVTFQDEYGCFVESYGLHWRDEHTGELICRTIC
jgi:putative transposase